MSRNLAPTSSRTGHVAVVPIECKKKLFATGAPPRTPLDELTAFPQTGKGLAAISPKTSPPLSAFWASDFGPSALAADAK